MYKPWIRRLPILQFPGDAFGDAAAQQAHQEKDAHGQCYHQQDVVLGWWHHHLEGQVCEAISWSHLSENIKKYI